MHAPSPRNQSAWTNKCHCLILAVLLGMSCLLLSACEEMHSSTLTLRKDMGPPTFTQDQVVTLMKPFHIKINKCYWADEFVKPGFDKLPERFREAQRQQFVVKPNGKFLIIEFSVINPTEQPIRWNSQQPLTFMLINSRNRQYASVGQDINMDDLSAKMILGSGNINPDMALAGKKVFDVPQDDYLLLVGTGTHTGGWQFAQGPTRFKWSLSPAAMK